METTPALTAAQLRLRAAAYQGKFKDPDALAVTAQVLIALQALVQIVFGVIPLTGTQVFYLTAKVTEPLFLATAVVFLMWFRRCRLNAEALAPGQHTYTSGVAVTSWFIPVLMWWAPRRAMLDTWRAGGGAPASRLINAWWIAWLVKSVGVSAYMVLDLNGDPNAPWIVVVNSVAAVLAIVVIRRVSTPQSVMLRSLTALDQAGGFRAGLGLKVPR